MSPEQLEALCEAARKRVAYFVARMAGQHLRRMKEKWSTQA